MKARGRRGFPIIIGGATALIFAAIILGKVSLYRIETGSMEPAFPVGTIVITSELARPEPHHAITFEADGRVVTHVLLGTNPDGSLKTRGIANPVPDRWRTPVYPGDVRGRVLFQILLFAPAFWLSWRGAAVIIGFCLVVGAVYCWRKLGLQPYHPARAVTNQFG